MPESRQTSGSPRATCAYLRSSPHTVQEDAEPARRVLCRQEKTSTHDKDRQSRFVIGPSDMRNRDAYTTVKRP